MGKNTRNFRQSKKSLSGNTGARNFAGVNRQAWHQKLFNFIKVRGKAPLRQGYEEQGGK